MKKALYVSILMLAMSGCVGEPMDVDASDELVGEVEQDLSGYSVHGNPSWAYAGSTVAVNWSAPAGHSSVDWVGLYEVNRPSNQDYLINYSYVNSSTSGTVYLTIPNSARGLHEFRYFLHNEYGLAAISGTMEVVAPPRVCRSLRAGDPWYPEWIYCCDNAAQTDSYWQTATGRDNGWYPGTCYGFGVSP